MPWNAKEQEDEEKTYKYQYHPGGDVTQPLQNAPNALNEVVIPNVSLPEVRLISFWFLLLRKTAVVNS